MSRPITDVLRDLRRGGCVAEATDALADLVNAVTEHGKAGRLTIELTVRPATRGTGALVIADKIAVKMPVPQTSESLMFATPEGSLLPEDPRQSKLELRAAEAQRPDELRTVGGN